MCVGQIRLSCLYESTNHECCSQTYQTSPALHAHRVSLRLSQTASRVGDRQLSPSLQHVTEQ